jgi:DnaJ-class molecular chaperone
MFPLNLQTLICGKCAAAQDEDSSRESKKTDRALPQRGQEHPRVYVDACKILGVSADANAAQFKVAFRKAIKREHPDKSKRADAHQRFIEIDAAYKLCKSHRGFNN